MLTQTEKRVDYSDALEAENWLIASVLIEPECFPRVRGLVGSSDFLQETSRYAWNAFLWLDRKGVAIDLFSVAVAVHEIDPRITRKHVLEWMHDPLTMVPTAIHAEWCARHVRRCAQERGVKDRRPHREIVPL